ncbi:tetratricopeptide repeat protein [Tenacibaculum agarivorans]|uniref:tetratricopeptide repeat protein n=1 Tax=Tenacibaculum agarivorans TaxID=1908389 RepID=UPI00094B9AEB|nr:tetratricopeptide repeat protein [Tenacibaculum agarivorans]
MFKRILFSLFLLSTISIIGQGKIASTKKINDTINREESKRISIDKITKKFITGYKDDREKYLKEYTAIVKDSTLRSLAKKLVEAKTDSLEVEALLKFCGHQKGRDFDKIPIYATQILKTFKNADYDIRDQKIKVLIHLGIYKRRLSRYAEALEHYFAAEKLLIEVADTVKLGITYHNMASVYKNENEYSKAKTYFKKAIAINEHFKRYVGLGNNYDMLSRVYQLQEYQDSAFYSINQAIYYHKKANNEEGGQQSRGNKAVMLTKTDRFKEALPLLLEYYAYVTKINKRLSIIATESNLGRTYMGLKKYDKALLYLNSAIDKAIKVKSKHSLMNAYKNRYKMYQELDKNTLALKDLESYMKLNKEVYNTKSQQRIKNLEISHEVDKQKYRDSLQFTEEKKRLQIAQQLVNNRRNSVIGLLTVLFLAIFSVLYLRNKQKIKEHAYQNILLNNKIATKTEEINELLSETMRHIKSKERIADNLQKLSNEKEGITLKSIIADLKANKADNAKLMLIKQNIEQVNFEFIKKLKELHPDLTKTDIEICSLIRIGLSRKEVASIRNTSLEAVKSSRFRLKKKLNLSVNENLDRYVEGL